MEEVQEREGTTWLPEESDSRKLVRASREELQYSAQLIRQSRKRIAASLLRIHESRLRLRRPWPLGPPDHTTTGQNPDGA
ncbi:hypothetical protein GPA10_40970 [Streptomyces sp. p1417]|uniref:Uncharacterized protein n=1 Tax=Streptomyces typhae TaxID=2681492 RepID=A0A6L6XB66_9ACTN|nr:hypothetical protein [Streptomyces typhae]MVO90947.1 hypothetical protein [Streptomyces typhae]